MRHIVTHGVSSHHALFIHRVLSHTRCDHTRATDVAIAQEACVAFAVYDAEMCESHALALRNQILHESVNDRPSFMLLSIYSACFGRSFIQVSLCCHGHVLKLATIFLSLYPRCEEIDGAIFVHKVVLQFSV